jgi:hypothetical protein
MVDGSDSPSVLWNALIEFRTNAQIACDRLEQEGHDYQGAVRSGAIDIPVPGSDGGSRKKSVKTARDGVGDLIGGIYDQCAANPTLKGRATFLQLVTGRRQRG